MPPSYHDTVLERVGDIDEDLAVLKQHGVLVDRDDEGYLLQLLHQAVARPPHVVLRDHPGLGLRASPERFTAGQSAKQGPEAQAG